MVGIQILNVRLRLMKRIWFLTILSYMVNSLKNDTEKPKKNLIQDYDKASY